MIKMLDVDKLKSRFSREISDIIQTVKDILRNLIKDFRGESPRGSAEVYIDFVKVPNLIFS